MRTGWVRYRGACVRLAPGWYDLRASAVYLARKHRRLDYGGNPSPAWSVAFCRAVRGLVQRGQLLRPSFLVPLAEIDEDSPVPVTEHVEFLDDGAYLRVQSPQLRFVSVNPKILALRS
jgi:hypothetical protein